MKQFLLSLFVAAFFAASLSPAIAQVPRMFSYQGVVIDPTSGKFITDGNHNILLNLYDALGSATPIYTENQTGVVFVNGIFNVMIGSVTSIPLTVAFDKGYFLGVSIDGGTEMTPRTPLSPAPYAIHAMVADAVSPGATGVVTSVNSQSGAVVLKAGNGTSITTSSVDTLTINSTIVGGIGVSQVLNSDASIVVANQTGPVASVSVAIAGITTTKIADGAVTPVKLDGSGGTAGMVLAANGLGGVTWQSVAGGGSLTLPYSGTIGNAGNAFSLTNTGNGGGGVFTISNGASTAIGLEGASNGAATSIGLYGGNTGSGRAGFIEINNAANTSTALTAKTQGLGDAEDVTVANALNSSNALQATTNGTGRAGFFQITNSASTKNALEGITNGEGSGVAGTASYQYLPGVYGHTTHGFGVGVYGTTSDNGAGLVSNSGVMGSSGGGQGVDGLTNTGDGVVGEAATTGIGIHGYADASTARAAVFGQGVATVSANVLEAVCIGTAEAGYFQINNANNSSAAVDATTNGTSTTSFGIVGTHSAISGTAEGVRGVTNSTTVGSGATVGATGVLGLVTSASPGSWSAAVRGINNSTSGSGIGVVGYQGGSGWGVYGEVGTNGRAVYGNCNGAQGGSGVYGFAPAGSWAVYSAGKLEVSIDNAIKPTTNTWTIASDARLKNVLRPFTDGLDVLLQINPIWYRYNGLAGLPTETDNIGILAQDMKQIAPYTVGTTNVKMHPDDKELTEIYTYNSHAITYVTINAIKELNQKIADLELQIQAMQQMLQANGINPASSGLVTHR